MVRTLVAIIALAAGVLLAGCDTDSIAVVTNSKATRPVPPKLLAKMEEKNMDLQSPILIRIFNQEAELEVWKQNREGRFDLLQTYPICRWSGDLGPKVAEGDRQAPEGFYSITPAQMNPNSAYYLSFNTGFPNAFDKALGRTGSELMVHGDCSSRGCYAMTDEQISEIYALGRESFFGGQRAFQLQAYPFHMTAQNLAKHRNNPNMPFWKMIKEGSDHFELTRLEPKVDFCEKHYVFDAQAPAGSTKPPVFNASAKCPAYEIAPDLAESTREKEAKDDAAMAELVARGTPVARLHTGIDGGMNTVFASKVENGRTGLSDNTDTPFSMAAYAPAPGTIPPTVNPPKGLDEVADQPDVVRPTATRPAPKAAAPSAVASIRPAAAATRPTATAQTQAQPAPQAATSKVADAKPAKPAPQTANAQSSPTPSSTAQAAPQNMTGAQPIVQGSSFDSRWSSF
jgi:murein L,D-transpeptidase YafK